MKLKPCPCCGCQDIVTGGDDPFNVYVKCPVWKGGCNLQMVKAVEIGLKRWQEPLPVDWRERALNEAIEAWNNRLDEAWI